MEQIFYYWKIKNMATKYMKTFFSESVRGPAIAHTCAIVCVCVSGI